MSIALSQKFVLEESKKFDASTFKVTKTIKGPGEHQFKIYDL